MSKRVLKPECQILADDFMSKHDGDIPCACHINSPCSFCTDPDNPNNIREDNDSWVEYDCLTESDYYILFTLYGKIGSPRDVLEAFEKLSGYGYNPMCITKNDAIICRKPT